MYKAAIILYVICFTCYLFFSRVPDYFESDFAKGQVQQMTFLAEEQSNIFEASYKVGSETFVYKAATGFLQNYEPGEQVTIIYNPSNPQTACVYSFIGYWVQWGELFFTAAFFTLLFAVARYITIPVYKSETLVLAE